ncbi:MAG: universal stress protein [Thermodesulfobacterium sp.]|nr:universal stress protein [Thermodesulfobacterium sp.]
MVEFKVIAIPVDFSEISSVIAEWGKALAKKLRSKIILINVVEDLPAFEDISADAKTFQELEEIIFEGAREYMQNFLNKHFSDFPDVKPVIVKGKVVEKIIEVAKENGVDLIVMGTHGKKGIDKIIFGSVAEGVVKYSPIPVLTINPYRIKEK